MNNIIEIKTNYEDRFVKNYILPSNDYFILIDSGIVSAWDEVYQKINTVPYLCEKTKIVVINTHEHWDHIGLNTKLVKEKNAFIFVHKAGKRWMEDYEYQFSQSFDAFSPELIPDIKTKENYWREIGKPTKVDIYLTGGEIIKNEKYELNVVYTPGHSPGSVCLFESQKGFLFSGDTVQGNGFFGKLPLYTNVTQYLDSLKKLKDISPTIIFGGHTPTIEGRKSVKQELDTGIQTIEKIEETTRNILNRASSNKKLSDIVSQVCRKLNAKYSIHAFFSVLAHINNMKDDVPLAADIVDKYIKGKNLMLYKESCYEK
jgi:hydroxyacylglutathione hydrolase